MICKNCGKEIPDGSRFCTECGSPITQEPAVQEPVSENVTTQPMNENIPPQPMSENVPPQPVNGNVPPQPVSGNVPPQPVNGNVPPQPMNGNIPSQPVNGAPQFNNGPGALDGVAEKVKKNKLPLILGGVGLVAIIAAVVIIVNIMSNLGYKGTLNKLEKALNKGDAKLAMECYPDFYFDDDADDEDILSAVGFGDNDMFEDVDFSFDVVSEEEVTDEDCSLSYDGDTWAEYIADYYEDHCDDYDDEEISEVIEAKVKMEIDTDSAADDILNALLKGSKVKMIFAKVDGKWCFFRTIS